MRVGQKINIQGPDSFALYPGQMSRVIKGHSLRSNQYLLARVYEATAANSSVGDVRDADGNIVEINQNYTNGQILVIKGTEISFYIPPTGIEVIPINNEPSLGYVREAVTLERLEYCILKDEQGSKRYVHGPSVVFPEPTESFVTSPKGGYVFRALELSKISGIYVKVIADYADENGTKHFAGEEMFITGNDQMIYYPRPEHAIITYDEKVVHHAIAIPEGEGRYIMNRLTGEISTLRGPAMYLPDPRTEIVVKRKLTPQQCALWYPNNREVAAHNNALTEKAVEKSLKKGATMDAIYAVDLATDAMNSLTSSVHAVSGAITTTSANLASFESNASIARGTSYTKPRTITLDNKYDGVVAINVWSGYAVNVISINGERKTVCGPQTILLDYDQTLETYWDEARNCYDVYLKYDNNVIKDYIVTKTSDHVECKIGLNYYISFLDKYKDKWFNIGNYFNFIRNQLHNRIINAVMEHNIEDFYHNYAAIIYGAIIGNADECVFEENGVRIYDCNVTDFTTDNDIEQMFLTHHSEMLERQMKLEEAEEKILITNKLAEIERKEHALESEKMLNRMTLQREEAIKKIEIQTEINRRQEAEKLTAQEAEKNLQSLINEVHKAKLAREKETMEQELEQKRQLAAIEEAKQKAYADTVTKVMGSISDDLVAALQSKANADVTIAIAEALAPYALANSSESVSDVVNKITRGLPLEDAIKNIGNKIK